METINGLLMLTLVGGEIKASGWEFRVDQVGLSDEIRAFEKS